MADTGLWNIARDQPDLVSLVDPGGREIDYATLAAYADRYGRGLQQLGLQAGDCLVAMLPNTIELVALYFAAMECGLYIVPINWHLTGPEVAYIVDDCDAKAFVGHERFADAATVAAAGLDPQRRVRRRRRSTGSGQWPNSRPAADVRTTAPRARRWSTRRARPASRRA